MLHWLLLPLCMILGAATFRIRGGYFEGWRYQPGDQLSRLSWAGASALTALLAGAPWWLALALLPCIWAVSTEGLMNSMDMGRNVDAADHGQPSFTKRFLRDFAFGHLHGLGLGIGAAIPLAFLHWACPIIGWGGRAPLWWASLVGGAAWGLCYALAWIWPLPTVKLHLGKSGAPPETGELWFGAEFAAALFIAASPYALS